MEGSFTNKLALFLFVLVIILGGTIFAVNQALDSKSKTGPQGPKGEQGEHGPAGSQGPPDSAGIQGVEGEKGNSGPKGDKGPAGATGSAGADAGPTDASYLLLGLDTDLSDERVLAAGTNIALADGGANGLATLSVIDSPSFAGDLSVNGGDMNSTSTPFNFNIGDPATFNFTDGTNTLVSIGDSGTTGTITITGLIDCDTVDTNGAGQLACGSDQGGGAPGGASYIVLSFDATLSAERVLTAGGTLTLSDGGPNSTLTIATASDPTFVTSVSTPLLTNAGNLTISTTVAGEDVILTPADALIISTLGSGILHSSSSGFITSSAVNLASADVTGALAVSNGGTGSTSLTVNGVLFGNGASPIQTTSAGSSGQVLLANGSGVPAFTTVSGDINITSVGLTTIQPNSVALTTDTTGNYVGNVANGSGIQGGSAGSEGASLALSLGPLASNWDQAGAFDIILNNASSDIDVLGVYKQNGASGISSTCTSGNTLSGLTVSGGIITSSGLCVAVGPTLQGAYDNSSSPAAITTSSAAKTILIKAGTGFDSTSLFQIQGDAGSSETTLRVDSTNMRVGVGLGATAPSTTLHVGGTITANGDILPNVSPTAGSSSQTSTSVDTTDDVGISASMVLGPDGFPIIAYVDETNSSLRLVDCNDAACSGADETFTNVDGVSGCPSGCSETAALSEHISAVLSNDGFPVIAYEAGGALKVVKCGNSACSSGNTYTMVDANDGAHNAIAVGHDGFPVISYHNFVAGLDLTVAKCGNASCSSGNTITTVDEGAADDNEGFNTSIAIGADGFPVISYHGNQNITLSTIDMKVVKCGTASCSSGNTITIVEAAASQLSQGTSIVIGTDGIPLMSYANRATGDFKIVRCGNAQCSSGNSTTTIDDGGVLSDNGRDSSLKIGKDGLPVASYFHNDNSALKVIKCGNLSCASGNTLTLADDPANIVGLYTSMAIGSDGLPVIAHYDESGTDMKITKCADPACKNADGGKFSGGSSIGSVGQYFNNIYGAAFWGKSFAITAFDLAEEYPVEDTSISAGDVVRLSAKGGLLVEKTSAPHELAIGIISSEPAITLGSWHDQDKSKLRTVALSGRVPVKVTDEGGPINAGDRLTSSSKPGYAMKLAGPGPAIGTALEMLNSGEGKILVFVDRTISPAFDLHAGNITTATLKVRGHITGNFDTRGQVTVKAGELTATYKFKNPYSKIPDVFLTATNAFPPEYRVEPAKDGFTVYLKEPAEVDLIFNYQAQG